MGGRVRTPEPITAVASVTMVSCGETVNVDHTVDGQWVVCEYRNRPVPSGVVVTVTYTHSAEVSDDVVAEVAGIVARHLTVDPTSAEAQSVRLATDSFSQQFADWVSDTGLLTESECEMARSYRYPGSTVVIQRP